MSTSTSYDSKQMATGYPASAPPAPTYYNPNSSHEDVQPKPSKACTRVCSLILFVLIGGGIGLMAYSIISIPIPKHPDFRVDSVLIPSFNTSSHSTVNWNVDFVVGNPNDRYNSDLIFDPIIVSSSSQNNFLGQKNDFLGGTVMSPISLSNGTETKMSAKFTTPGTVFDDVYNRSFGGQNSGGVKFDFKLTSGVHFAEGDRVYSLNVLCNNVLVGFLPDTRVGSLSGGPVKCHVHWS